MVKESKLYFSRLAEYTDPYEGTLPKFLTGQIEEVRKVGYGLACKYAGVSCWHESNCESVAMWRLYVPGPEGVAIQTTMAKLKQLDERGDYTIGRVRYLNYEEEGQPNGNPMFSWLDPYRPLLQKRKSFEHEKEVRLIILQPAYTPYQTTVPANRVLPGTGFGVRVRLPDLIERVVVSPELPSWAVPPLQQVVDAAGLTTQIEQSDLLKPPNKECDEAFKNLLETIKPGFATN
jgi:hypothetical protein